MCRKIKDLRSPSIFQKTGRLPYRKEIEVVFHNQKIFKFQIRPTTCLGWMAGLSENKTYSALA